MRVVRINAVYGYNSTGRTVQQLDNELVKYGVESSTVYAYGSGTRNDYHMGCSLGKKLHGLFARIFGNAGYYSTLSTAKMLRYIKRINPDIVHLHLLHSNFVNLPMLLRFLAKNDYPTVVTLDDCWYFTGKCCHFTSDNCYKWRDECGNCPRLKKDVPSLLLDRTYKLRRDKERGFTAIPRLAVIGVSDWITNEARKSFFNRALILKRIYNWIDTETFRPVNADELRAKYDLDDKYLILAVSSGWHSAKGLYEFVELSKELPENMRLALLGDVPRNTDLGRILNIPAIKDPQELAKWYSAADVFISLSREESFGKVAAESLACGTPIIVMNTTASPELVGKNCGETIEDTSPQTIIAAIGRMALRGKSRMTEHCRRFVTENFSMSACIEYVYNTYIELLENGKG